MASPSAETPWVWDFARNEYRRWVAERNCWVYQSGLELATQQPAAPEIASQGVPAQTSVYDPRDASALEDAVRRVSISDSASHQRSASQSSSAAYSTYPQHTTSSVSGYGPAAIAAAHPYHPSQTSNSYPYGGGVQPGLYSSAYPGPVQPSYVTTPPQQIQPGPSTQQQPWGQFKNHDGVWRALQGPPAQDITPRSMFERGVMSTKKILKTPGKFEPLDPSYKRRGKDFFHFGKVFRVLWAESAGDVSNNISIVTDRFGESIHTKIRWFVVIRADPKEKSCTALPIHTYSGQGVGKRDVIKNHHAIIYTGPRNRQPTPLASELPQSPNEYGMRESIRVVARKPDDRLDPMSRVNYVKVVTVEYNIKASDFGEVHKDSENVLWGHFWAVWNPSRFSGPSSGQQLSNSAIAPATAAFTYATPATSANQALNPVQEEIDDDDDEDDGDDDESSAGDEGTNQ